MMLKGSLYKPPKLQDEERKPSIGAAQSYWQELFHSDQLSPPEYKYLFPDLSNLDNEAVKGLLTYKLTDEMALLSEVDWSGHDAVGLTAFWLKILSEPKIAQLRKCKLDFVARVVEQLASSDLLSSSRKSNGNGVAEDVGGAMGGAMGGAVGGAMGEAMTTDVTCLDLQTTGLQGPPYPTSSASLAGTIANNSSSGDALDNKGMYRLPPKVADNQAMTLRLSFNADHTGSEMQQSESLLYQEDGKPLHADENSESSTQWTVIQSGNEAMFSCNTCHYMSPYKSRIKQHMRSVHSSVKPYKCEFCDHTTAIRASLTKHINAVHKKVKPFSCHLCSYSCNLKSSLEVHLSGYHQKTYRYSCPHCDYAAAAKNVVDIHIQAVHMKEKPYKCPHCDYRSAYPQYIPKHVAAVHERKKPYACPHCEYRSSYKTYLQKHCDAVHNNIKPYACPHCSYTTSYSQYLSKHISAVHNDEKPHKCPLCDFRCAYKQYISKHIELVHSGSRNAGSGDSLSVTAKDEPSTNGASVNEDNNDSLLDVKPPLPLSQPPLPLSQPPLPLAQSALPLAQSAWPSVIGGRQPEPPSEENPTLNESLGWLTGDNAAILPQM